MLVFSLVVNINVNTISVNVKELAALEKAVRGENQRIQAIKNKNKWDVSLFTIERTLKLYDSDGSAPKEIIDLDNNVEGINWGVVAEKVKFPLTALDNSRLSASRKVSGVSAIKRSAEECRIRWVGDRHPRINHGAWNSEEHDQLSRLIVRATEASSKVDWVDIAKQLGVRWHILIVIFLL